MPTKDQTRHHNPLAGIRVVASDWTDFATATNGLRADVLRQFIAWYLHHPGAELPDRPTPAE